MNSYKLPLRTVTHETKRGSTSLKQPPLTKIDHLLEGELAGRPISFQEIDYTPALAASPFHISHFLSFTMDSPLSLVFLRMITSWKTSSWRRDLRFGYLILTCHFTRLGIYHLPSSALSTTSFATKLGFHDCKSRHSIFLKRLPIINILTPPPPSP